MSISNEQLTVAKLGEMTGMSIEKILNILTKAGIHGKSASSTISSEEKSTILVNIRKQRAPLQSNTLKKGTLRLKKKPSPDNETILNTGKISIIELDKKTTQSAKKISPATPKKNTTHKNKDTAAPIPSKTLSVEEVLASRAEKKEVKTKNVPDSGDDLTALAATKASTPKQQISIPGNISVSELATLINQPATAIIKAFFELGEMVTLNQNIDFDQAQIALEAMGYNAILAQEVSNNAENSLDDQEHYGKEDYQPRAPIVTIMGHVDHGKTSLLDYIRKTKIADKEAGGITQHIGAYQVATNHGPITFLDTPGHEAFTAMRARGAKTTDIVVLVVAANDGVMPQTIEAIQHAKAADVPIIVAVNKIDKAEADPEKIRTELGKHELIPEDWGGETIFQNISAKTGENIDTLLDSIALQAEMMELTANYSGQGRGIIIETRLDMGLGATATILVQSGTFTQGQTILVGEHYGKIRTMNNSFSKKCKTAQPADAVEITGLSGVPNAGDSALSMRNDKKAREIAQSRQIQAKLAQAQQSQKNKQDLFSQRQQDLDSDGRLNLIIKTDVHGSLEALLASIQKQDENIEDIQIRVIASGIGGISCSDIHLAKASAATIIGFNVRADASARRLQQSEGVNIKNFGIIYDVLDYIEQEASGLQKPKEVEVVLGSAEVKELFRASKSVTISGCQVSEGVIKRNALARIIRNDKVIYSGKIESLRRFSEQATEVKAGLECGIGIKGYSDIKVGDSIEAYNIELK